VASGNEKDGRGGPLNQMTMALQSLPTVLAKERKVQKIVLPGQTTQGEHILSLLVKRTYNVIRGGRCARAPEDRKLTAGDVHYGDPVNSTVKFESDFVPFKIGTDVVLNGKVYAPRGKRVATLTASLVIGKYRKDILVIGDRTARYQCKRDPLFTEPQPFEALEIRYERAYGGVDIFSEPKMPCVYPRNHLGRGYVIANTQRSLENVSLPNFEDPNDQLTPARLCTGSFKDWKRQPMPQGFGWTMKTWAPRSLYAGIMPADAALAQELRKNYALLVPPAQRKAYEQAQIPPMDFRFFNGASAGLTLPFLEGSERVRLIHLDAFGDTEFDLPSERPRLGLDIGNGVHEPAVVLQTVMIRMEENQMDLVWRGAVPYPGPDWLPQMKKMEVLIE
jgi:hypothetical protein